ncbi:hypothetical protein OG429_40050 [Streptomyces sp. NBC_00190]|uniref:UDP binding domain-containing protein n=1 Tax=Streptomyces sp. NBC_00190 TaxID=2903634 RepID=UPI002E2AB304|nr:UDP binding domain-containing protein [Streptomyces sp. NBC_00190]
MSSTSEETDYGQLLGDRRIRLAVWGLGYIGWSTVEAFAAKGVEIAGYDPDPERVAQRRATESGLDVAISSDSQTVLSANCLVHMIAVPTERDGAPCQESLQEVFEELAAAIAHGELRGRCPIVIVESTLTPGTTGQLIVPILRLHGLEVGRDLGLALAPRRDWFLAEGQGMRELDRIYAGYDQFSSRSAASILELVNDTLHQAPGHLEGELVKCVENAYRHMDISLANQLTLAFPDINMVEVLRLAGTKWNVGTYHPSFGTGGYCIPLASRYLLLGAPQPKELSLLEAAVETDERIRQLVAEAASGGGPVFVMGIAYKGNIKVDILSPARAIVTRLLEAGIETTVWDPMYTAAEIDAKLGAAVAATDVQSQVARARTVLIVADHREFLGADCVDALNAPRDERLVILDNYGALQAVPWRDHVSYFRAGSSGWLRSCAGEN